MLNSIRYLRQFRTSIFKSTCNRTKQQMYQIEYPIYQLEKIFSIMIFTSNYSYLHMYRILSSRIQFNILLLNCAIACIIECILNCLMSVIYILTQPGWELGPWPCYINSFFMEFVPILYTTFLILLVLDRYFAVRDPMTYRKNYNNQSKFKFAIVFYWILSIGAIFPLAIGIIQSWPFPDRYSCQVGN